MYLTAQHVVSPAGSDEGVNAFLYLHGDDLSPDLPPNVPDDNPGTLVAESLSVAPPGNRVRSYLDIVSSDRARWEDVRVGLMDLIGRAQRTPLPWSGHAAGSYFRIGMDTSLARNWQRELAALYRAAQALWLASSR